MCSTMRCDRSSAALRTIKTMIEAIANAQKNSMAQAGFGESSFGSGGVFCGESE